MAIRVTTSNGAQDFGDATAWHVDGHGYLHIMKEDASVATFHPQWQSVERIEDVSAESTGASEAKTGKTPA